MDRNGHKQAGLHRQLEQALGEEKIAWLLKQTGMSREALLEG